MDPVKIGNFLRDLRKEKNMTQEALAEVFQVSNRTISRWETGSNMPDISLLVEIADYYDLDIREIINGERKQNADLEVKDPVSTEENPSNQTMVSANDALKELADYADSDNEKLATRTRIYAMIGLISMIFYVGASNFAPDNMGLNLLKRLAVIMVYAALSASILYTTDRLQILRRKYMSALKTKLLPTILIVAGAILLLITFIIALVPFFLIGEA